MCSKLLHDILIDITLFHIRPTNDSERIGKAVTVVDTPSNKEIVIRERSYDTFSKKFTFDRVFGSFSRQVCILIK